MPPNAIDNAASMSCILSVATGGAIAGCTIVKTINDLIVYVQVEIPALNIILHHKMPPNAISNATGMNGILSVATGGAMAGCTN